MPFITKLSKHVHDIVPARAGGAVDSNGASCQPDFPENAWAAKVSDTSPTF